MIEREVDLQTEDGLMNTFITYPDEGGPFPVVLFYMDAPGKREELHDMARRIATVGYYVLLPNLYYRDVREVTYDGSDAARRRMFELMGTLTIARINSDTRAMLDFLEGEEHARPGKVGCVGYCMSGQFVLAVAGAFPERIAAGASMYGVRMVTDAPDSPHLTANRVRGELYFGCAEIDEYAPPAMIDALDTHLKNAGVRYRIEWYPGTHHGFAFPQRPAVYNKAAAERHWSRLFALFERNL